MNNTVYSLDSAAGMASSDGNAWDLPALLNDMADQREFNQADALAASGDYFVTLATKLDMISQSLPRDSAEQIEIENLIQTLFYLQKHYKLVAKHKLS